MIKDWTGNSTTTFSILGASSHSKRVREIDDYYATDPKAVQELLDREKFCNNIWEPACGEGHISKVLESNGYNVKSSDKVDRGYGEIINFLEVTDSNLDCDIITNPPYKYALDFVNKSLDVIYTGHRVAMFLKIQFLEGKNRHKYFKINPPQFVYVFSYRVNCGLNGNFNSSNSSAVCYAWFIWEKGFRGEPIIRWI